MKQDPLNITVSGAVPKKQISDLPRKPISDLVQGGSVCCTIAKHALPTMFRHGHIADGAINKTCA